MKKNKLLASIVALPFLLACMATAASQELPRVHGAADMDALVRQGYVLMDDITTPLLHHVATGEPYDLRMLATGDGNDDAMRFKSRLRDKAAANDEFVRASVAEEWAAYIEERVRALRAAPGYLIEMRYRWGEYDFKHRRFPIQLKFNKTSLQEKGSHFCMGAYRRASKLELRTACMVAPALNNFAAPLSVFPMADVELARQVKQQKLPVAVFALVEVAAPYKVLRGNELRYMPLDIVAASGVQAVTITDLLLVRRQVDGGPFLAVSHVGGSTRTARAPAAPVDQRWQRAAQDARATSYIDAGAARRSASHVTVPILQDFSDSKPGSLRSMEGLYSFDCAERSVRLLDLKTYHEPMGKGAVAEHDDVVRQHAVAPGTNLETLLNHACNLPSPARS